MAYYQGYQPYYQQTPYYQPQNQTQNGFVRVQNENEARMYPVAPGTSVIFIDENSPFCYTKSVDVSQLDRPKFSKYRLVKQEDNDPGINQQSNKQEEYATLNYVNQQIEKIKELITSTKQD